MSKNFVRGYEKAFSHKIDMPRGYAAQKDANIMDSQSKLPITTLSTDPPYYDNIGYADLSDFFYVWLRRNLRDVYPELFSTLLVPKTPELIVAPHRHADKQEAKAFFEAGMLETFSNLRQSVRADYPVSIYYAYKQQDMGIGEDRPSSGWETMLSSLIRAGFQIVGTWPMRTELGNRSNSLGANALASSIVLVCRVRPEDAPEAGRRDFSAALRRELRDALDQLLSGNLAATDLAQASIGPGMAIFSRFSRVLEPDGREMSVRVALGLINRALDDFFAEQDGEHRRGNALRHRLVRKVRLRGRPLRRCRRPRPRAQHQRRQRRARGPREGRRRPGHAAAAQAIQRLAAAGRQAPHHLGGDASSDPLSAARWRSGGRVAAAGHEGQHAGRGAAPRLSPLSRVRAHAPQRSRPRLQRPGRILAGDRPPRQ